MDMELKLEVVGKRYDGNLRDIVKINEAILTEEFIKQPSLYAWFATLMEFASAEMDTEKMNLDILSANLDSEKRVSLLAEGKKATESMVASAIEVDAKHIQAKKNLIEASRKYGVLRAIVRALEQRKDMLIQIGSTKRQEMTLDNFGVNLDRVKKNNT